MYLKKCFLLSCFILIPTIVLCTDNFKTDVKSVFETKSLNKYYEKMEKVRIIFDDRLGYYKLIIIAFY